MVPSDSEKEVIVEDESDDSSQEDSFIGEYDIVASPNDFNTKTLISFIDKGFFKVPGFQRNYVWDIGRASRLIESVVLGLPIPQVFLYEESKNQFLLIDGQQRLLSLYFFAKKRFPKKEQRPALRQLIDKNGGKVPDGIIEDDKYFQRFNLSLPKGDEDEPNPLHGLNHSTLGDKADTYDFRTIRSIVIKQLSPQGDGSVFEIFNRLNSGGVNLRPQEMRASLYHSKFFELLHQLNALPGWRTILGVEFPDVRMKDSEVLLRAIGMLVEGTSYKPSMVRFLNRVSKSSRSASPEELELRRAIVERFMEDAGKVGAGVFQQQATKLSVPVFETVFVAACQAAYLERDPAKVKPIDPAKVAALKTNDEFLRVSRSNSADTANVNKRLEFAKSL